MKDQICGLAFGEGLFEFGSVVLIFAFYTLIWLMGVL